MLVFFSLSTQIFVVSARINHLSVILKVYIKGDGKKALLLSGAMYYVCETWKCAVQYETISYLAVKTMHI